MLRVKPTSKAIAVISADGP
jgi:uncharacterized protein YjbJ (UPF0337 family)